MDIVKRALSLKYDTAAALSSPMARMLPWAVIRIIEEQAELVADLAEVVVKLQVRMDMGECDEPE